MILLYNRLLYKRFLLYTPQLLQVTSSQRDIRKGSFRVIYSQSNNQLVIHEGSWGLKSGLQGSRRRTRGACTHVTPSNTAKKRAVTKRSRPRKGRVLFPGHLQRYAFNFMLQPRSTCPYRNNQFNGGRFADYPYTHTRGYIAAEAMFDLLLLGLFCKYDFKKFLHDSSLFLSKGP